MTNLIASVFRSHFGTSDGRCSFGIRPGNTTATLGMPLEPCEQIADRFYAAAVKTDGSSRSASKEVETSPKQKPHFVQDQRCETRSKM